MKNNEALELAKAYRTTFKSEKGKAVLLDMAKTASVFTETTDLTPAVMAYKEGQRAMLSRIFGLLDMKYEDIIKLYHNDWEGEEDE